MGLSYDSDRLMTDASYNVTIGSTYFNHLLGWNGSVPWRSPRTMPETGMSANGSLATAIREAKWTCSDGSRQFRTLKLALMFSELSKIA